MEKLDAVVIGAGIVGLAVGRALALAGREVVVLERQSHFGMETSSRNSEVIHAGIYYPPQSLKARFCVAGKKQLYSYCAQRHIAHRRIGKLIVAVSDDEVPLLHHYRDNALASGVDDLRLLNAKEVSEMEPEVRAVAGLFSPSTGIVDSHGLMVNYLTDIERCGGMLVANSAVTGGRATASGIEIRVGGAGYHCHTLINAAGLYAPAVAHSLNAANVPKAYYAKGHYFALSGKSPFNHLVYPLAGNAGLGVHVTLDIGGQARFGPDVEWIDNIDYHFSAGRLNDFVRAIRRYYPNLDETRLSPGYTGIRPKICGPNEPAADFMVQTCEQHGVGGLINLFGIESPGLTASLALADYVVKSCR